MRYDYAKVDWQFLSRILDENSTRLSRTRSGVSDTSASQLKRPLRLFGDELKCRARDNGLRVHQWIFATRAEAPPRDAAGVLSLLFTLADLTNDGLLPAGRLRTWDVSYGPKNRDESSAASNSAAAIPPEALPMALEEFAVAVHRRWHELVDDPVPLAAWSEWQLNAGPMHPFYDGCGRISRSFAALLLVRAGCLPPLYINSASYFLHANGGPDCLAVYVRERIAACHEWVQPGLV